MVRTTVARVVPCVLLAWYALETGAYVPVWRSNLTLWTHAAKMAPQKPRSAFMYGAYLLGQGRLERGMEAWARARRFADQPHVPVWDRRQTEEKIAHNMAALLGATR